MTLKVEPRAIEQDSGIFTFPGTIINGVARLQERAAAESDTPGYGQVWVKDDAPNTLWFTNDDGDDAQLGVGGGGGGQARKSLPVSAAHLPDDSANNAAAQIQKKTSSGGVLHPAWIEALFDDSTDEHIMWLFLMPDNYASDPLVDVYYKAASAAAGTAAFASALMAVTDGDAQDVDADAFDTINTGTATVPGTAGYLDVISITMSNDDGVAANDMVVMVVHRDVSEDNVSGDLEVPLCVLRYTST